MDLQEILSGVATLGYDFQHPDARNQPAQQHLKVARRELAEIAPPGYRVRVSGAAVNIPEWPWLAVMDPDVTTSARRGQYLVYLYSRDLTRLYLSVNQGVTAHREQAEQDHSGKAAEQAALAALDAESDAVRKVLHTGVQEDTLRKIDLGGSAYLPVGYEAGNVAALAYDPMNLPSENDLRSDLHRMLSVLDTAVSAKAELTLRDPQNFNTPVTGVDKHADEQLEFKPNDSSDYKANVPPRSEKRTRRHEQMLATYGAYLKSRDWDVGTNVHPRDLVARINGQPDVLCEVKTVGPNAEHAVRAVIGQLFTYRFMCYQQPPPPLYLLGVFTAPIGEGFVELNSSLGIMSVWRDGRVWRGSDDAVKLGLAEH